MKLVHDKTGKVIIAKKEYGKEKFGPTFKYCFGRTWDAFPIIINGKDISVHLDTTWGRRGHIYYKGNWYSVSIEEISHCLSKEGGDIWHAPTTKYFTVE